MKNSKYEKQKKLVEECKNSEISETKWCKEKGISYGTYRNWVRREKQEVGIELIEPAPKEESKSQWASVSLPKVNEVKSEPIQITCGDFTVKIKEGFNPSLLLEVMRMVQTLC